MPKPNLPAHRSGLNLGPLDRRERRQVEAMETSAALAHRELQLRREYAQAEVIADNALTQTAMASVTATAASAAALRQVAPEVAGALNYLQQKHVINTGNHLDDFSKGS